MEPRLSFYKTTVSKWIPKRDASILVTAGGINDRNVFMELAFIDVVITNIDNDFSSKTIYPYSWDKQNLEELTFPDNSFDYVVVHAGLHHCRSPHKALLEMYRVAKKAIIAFEPTDNFTVRLMQKINLAQTYEYTAVIANEGKSGGVNNTQIPNYIYRWTKAEIEKVINSYDPVARHKFYYKFGNDIPTPEYIGTNIFKLLLIKFFMPIYRFWGLCFPSQQNLFAFMVEKPDIKNNLHPWLINNKNGITFNPQWVGTKKQR